MTLTNLHSRLGTKRHQRLVSRESGASMIEVLVAILLVSVGLLGIAGLSGATFTYNKAAQVRLTGIALANDLADRARVNVYGYDRDDYNITLSQTPAASPVTIPAANLDLDPSVPATAVAVADALAAYDVDQFLRNVASRLPQGRAVTISRKGANARDLDVWLLWKEPKTDAADAAFSGNSSLFGASQGHCPNTLSAAESDEYSCMYFKVGL